MRYPLLVLLGLLLTTCRSPLPNSHSEVSKWDKLTLDFPGPASSEDAADNPFVNYRLDVTFRQGNHTISVPGFYAASADAAENGASAGNLWQVRFRPDREGEWTYEGALVQGDSIFLSDDPTAGRVVKNFAGAFLVGPAAPGERGKLVRDHPRYLRWAETGEYFIKTGVDSPENLLGYVDFDGTYRHSNEFREGESKTEGLHQFTAHQQDARPSDPTWMNGRGKALLGGLTYLREAGVNSIYFLTLNINGDGKDVWPYTGHEERYRFDVSKLAQWERVFEHADSLGMMLHFVLNETENETLLDGGDTGPQRRLYFRELVARFGHHRAVTWNLGEENGPNDWSDTYQTNDQQRQVIDWFAEHDPYGHYVVLHTHPGEEAFTKIYAPLLGNAKLDGLSLQLGDPYSANEVTRRWIDRSAEAGAPWIMTLDEVGPWYRGLDPDDAAPANNQDSLRALTLWGNLMAGGAGVEWYFGARRPHNDLNLEDWRSRDRAYRWSAHARHFFERYLPFAEMEGHNELTEGATDWCFAKPGAVYVVYLPFGRPARLNLSGTDGNYTLHWYNPRSGGELLDGEQAIAAGDGSVELVPPDAGDWVALLRRTPSEK